MSNPHETAMFFPRPYPSALTPQWKKYVIQGSTPNDTRLDFNLNQKSLIPRTDMVTYDFPSYPKPNVGNLDEDIDLEFMRIVSPGFPIWVEKIKICLHQYTTYGCVKINVWDYGDSEENIPTNLVGIDEGETAGVNIPLTILPETSLVSNALASQDLYMIESEQEAHISPFDYTISANSILRFGIQYAEGNAYGLKIFLIGWMFECDTDEEESESESESESTSSLPGGIGDFQMTNTAISLTSAFNLTSYTIPAGLKGYTLVNSNSVRDEYECEDEVDGKTYKLILWSYKDGSENQYIARVYITDSLYSEVYYTLTPAGQIYGTHSMSQEINATSLTATVTLS